MPKDKTETTSKRFTEMRNRYAVVQKKLQELQSQLLQVFTLPAETPYHQLLSEGIEHRLDFLKALLSAEAASHPSRPHHLDHIFDQLARLESAFREWDEFRTCANYAGDLDAGSVCSCTELDPCLNDEEESGSPACDVPEGFYEAVADGKAAEEAAKAESGSDLEGDKGGKGGVLERYCGVLASGMMLGAGLMSFAMTKFSCCHQCYAGDEGFLIPT